MEKLEVKDLKVGMTVHIEQLDTIMDTWVLLEKDDKYGEQGVIKFIGKRPNKESQKLLESGKYISCIYHDSELLSGEVQFDE